jgi:hypothetical protein
MSGLKEPLSPSSDRFSTASSSTKSSKHMLAQVYELHNSKNLSEDALEVLFRIRQRRTTVKNEIYAGFIQFLSCFYIMTLIPYEMKSAGYDKTPAFCTTVRVSHHQITPIMNTFSRLYAVHLVAFWSELPQIFHLSLHLLPL